MLILLRKHNIKYKQYFMDNSIYFHISSLNLSSWCGIDGQNEIPLAYKTFNFSNMAISIVDTLVKVEK